MLGVTGSQIKGGALRTSCEAEEGESVSQLPSSYSPCILECVEVDGEGGRPLWFFRERGIRREKGGRGLSECRGRVERVLAGRLREY